MRIAECHCLCFFDIQREFICLSHGVNLFNSQFKLFSFITKLSPCRKNYVSPAKRKGNLRYSKNVIYVGDISKSPNMNPCGTPHFT